MPILIYAVLCLGLGYMAKAVGRSFWLWSTLSVCTTPVIAFFVLMIVRGK